LKWFERDLGFTFKDELKQSLKVLGAGTGDEDIGVAEADGGGDGQAERRRLAAAARRRQRHCRAQRLLRDALDELEQGLGLITANHIISVLRTARLAYFNELFTEISIFGFYHCSSFIRSNFNLIFQIQYGNHRFLLDFG